MNLPRHRPELTHPPSHQKKTNWIFTLAKTKRFPTFGTRGILKDDNLMNWILKDPGVCQRPRTILFCRLYMWHVQNIHLALYNMGVWIALHILYILCLNIDFNVWMNWSVEKQNPVEGEYTTLNILYQYSANLYTDTVFKRGNRDGFFIIF